MNLFTKYLSQRIKNRPLAEFVAQWDQLEILVITVFKSKTVTDEDIETYARVHTWLHKYYPQWETDLHPLWQKTLVGGQLAPEDPFRRIFSAETAHDFLDDWVAMQNLAAAREALNQLIA